MSQKAYIQQGDVINALAPYTVTSGAGALIGVAMFGIAQDDITSGVAGQFKLDGVWDIAKDTSTFTDQALVYWDNTAKKATSVSSGNNVVGMATLLQPDGSSALGGLTGDATVRVRLDAVTVGIDPGVSQVSVVPLTAAQIIAMNGAPVTILAAPGAGKALLVENILFEITRTATAFTGGGVVSFQHHTTTTSVPHSGTIPAAIVTGGAGTVQSMLGPYAGANALVVPANEGIDITNATAAFAAGTGTAKVTVKYRTVTL